MGWALPRPGGRDGAEGPSTARPEDGNSNAGIKAGTSWLRVETLHHGISARSIGSTGCRRTASRRNSLRTNRTVASGKATAIVSAPVTRRSVPEHRQEIPISPGIPPASPFHREKCFYFNRRRVQTSMRDEASCSICIWAFIRAMFGYKNPTVRFDFVGQKETIKAMK